MNYDRSILACILRASAMRDTCRENERMVLAGVLLDPDGADIRCVATNGKAIAMLRACGNGLRLGRPYIISGLGLARLADLYRRNRQEIAKLSWKRGETGDPIITVATTVLPTKTDGLLFQVPSTGDSATVPISTGSFPAYRHAFETPTAWSPGFPPGMGISVRLLGLVGKALPAGGDAGIPMPRTNGRATLFLTDDGSYVGIMPISIGDVVTYPFGKPAELATAAQPQPVAEAAVA